MSLLNLQKRRDLIFGKMAQLNVVKLSTLENHRLDPEFYKEEYTKIYSDLSKFSTEFLGNLCFVTDGQHGYFKVDEKSEIRQIIGENILSEFNIIDKTTATRLDKSTHLKNLRSSLEENDLILSTVGTIGKVGVVLKEVLPANINQSVCRIKVEKKKIVDPIFLSIFLKSKYGQSQIEKYSTGQVQIGFYLHKVRNLIIPLIELSKQKEIREKGLESLDFYKKSVQLFNEAEELLLKELGLKDYQPKFQISFISNFLDTTENGRIDADYYQPKYEVLKKKLNKFENHNLSDIAIVTDGDHGSPEYLEDGVIFLRALNVRKYFLDFKDVKHVAEDYHKNFLKRSILREGDVVITKIGTIGVSAVIPNIEANTTASVGKIRIKKEFLKEFNPYYLSSFFNTLAGKLLIEMDTSGSVQTGIILKTLRNLEIPKIEYSKQSTIAEKIKQGIKFKEEAEKTLEEAINQVEKIIEEHI